MSEDFLTPGGQTHHLMIPGPTPLPDAVRQALARPPVGHRSPEFRRVLERVLPRLQWIFQTESDVFLYTASGTGAMEAALANTLNAGDKVLVLACGVFSRRWAEIAEALGLDVELLEVPYGEPTPVDLLKSRLAEDTDKAVRAVCLIHSETSTGVLNPVQDLAAVIRDHGALSLVDTVTGLGAAEFKFDDWGVDLAVSGSQKGFMIPPGLSFLAVGKRAWQAHEQCRHPGYYFNFSKTKKAQAEFNTPWTPSTALILALEAALDLMEAEGLENIIRRHARLQAMTRAGARAMDLDLFVSDDALASPAVTSILPPPGVSVDGIRAGLKQRFGLIVANGQKELKGKIFRIGHLGHQGERDVLMTLAALETVLIDLGYKPAAGGTDAARDVMLSLQKSAI